MDRMTSMATFVKVVESGGFSAAARALGISPSMVTTHVRALEERLAVRLLNRSTRKVSLTEAGHTYYERCLQILTDVEEAERIAEALQSTPRGTLRLNTSVAIPPFLAPVIAEFVSLYPEVSVKFGDDRPDDRPGGGGLRSCGPQHVGSGLEPDRPVRCDLPVGRLRVARLSRRARLAARAGGPRAP
jgi:DNA-binding transcriptional LysR family regulator